MATSLTDVEKAWFDSAEFATIATIEPDGRPHLSVVWVSRDGEDILVSTVEGRRKHRNLMADPRCTVLLYPKESAYTYVEIRGTASIAREGGRELIDEHSHKYRGTERYPGDDGTDNVRIVVRISPDKVIHY